MINWLISRVSSLFAAIDLVSNRLLVSLQRLYIYLTGKLDRVLYKLDEITKNLLRKYYRALEYLENFFRILHKLLRVLFPITLLFVPPIFGFLIAIYSYKTYPLNSIVLGVMSFVLLLMLVASFRSTAEFTTIAPAGQSVPLAIPTELDNFSFQRKIVGGVVAVAALTGAAYLNIGLLLGFLLFIAEVAVMYLLKWLYGTGSSQETPNPK